MRGVCIGVSLLGCRVARALAVAVFDVAGFALWLGLWPFLCLSLLVRHVARAVAGVVVVASGSPCVSGCGRFCVCRFWAAMWLDLWPFLCLDRC